MIGPELAGALVGLGIGVADFLALRMAGRAGRSASSAEARSRPLKLIGLMSLFVFPIVGWFVGPIVAESLGG